jgi:hypothetical protein
MGGSKWGSVLRESHVPVVMIPRPKPATRRPTRNWPTRKWGLAVASFGGNLELLLPRLVSRADVPREKVLKGEDVPLETLPNGKKSAPPIRTQREGRAL